MQVYNIEVFDNAMNCIHHEAQSEYEYDFDYLSPIQSKLELDFHDSNARFIRIVSDDRTVNLMGVIVSLDDGELMTVGFKPFIAVLDVPIMFSVNYQNEKDLDGKNTYCLESVLKTCIEVTFKNSSDALQNLPIGTITYPERAEKQTKTWGMNLKPDVEGQSMCKINLYDVLVTNSFSNYGIVVEAIPDPTHNEIDIVIHKIDTAAITLEIDSPGVTIKKFTVRDISAKTNKLTVHNKNNYADTITYFLHPDGTYSTTNTNRIFPVVPDVEAVDVNPSVSGSFQTAAKEAAISKFGNMKFDNLIQIEVAPTDTLIKPMALKIGQVVNIVHNGTIYVSIVSGIKYGDLIELTFGMIRIDATKRFRRLLK